MSISYSDLDLKLPQARKTLNVRIEAAAHELCWKVVDTRFVDDQISCRSGAIQGVRDQVRRAEWRAESATRVLASSTR